MDENEIINLFRHTLIPEYTKEAEAKLTAIKICQSFPQILVKIIDSENLEETVRHSATIMLKNIIREKWAVEEHERFTEMQRDVIRYTSQNDLFETDKKFIECSLVPLILKTTKTVIRDQLILCVSIVMKRSYPTYFNELPGQMANLIVSSGPEVLPSGLLILISIIKSQDSKGDNRQEKVYAQIMSLNMHLARVFVQYTPLDTPDACMVQILAYKLLVHINYVKRMIPFLGEQNLCTVLDCSLCLFARPPPSDVPPDDNGPSVWSKARKWAIRIFCEIFRQNRSNREFIDWFMERYAGRVINSIFVVFAQIAQNVDVSSYIMQYTITFLRYCIPKLSTWKILEVHMTDVVRHIFIRILSYNNKLIEEFQSDPQTFVEDYCLEDYLLYPDSAVRSFLDLVGMKRDKTLSVVVSTCMQSLNEAVDPQRYAVFSILGYIGQSLVKSEIYKNDMENLFVAHVFPSMKSANHLIRYKAYWLMESLINVPFHNGNNLMFVVERIMNGILNEGSLPVKYEAILLFDRFMTCATEEVLLSFVPYLKQFTMSILGVVKDLNCQRSSYVLEKMFQVFGDSIGSIAYDVTQSLVQLIMTRIQSGINVGDSAPVISGLISAVDTVIESVGCDISIQIDPLIEQIINLCFTDDLIIEMWDDLCMLLCTTTEKRVPPNYWKYFYRFMDVFPANSSFYFLESMMDWIHNFITVDTTTFLSNPDNFSRIMSTLELGMTSVDSEEMVGDTSESVMLAFKFYEIILITCKGRLTVEQMGTICTCLYKKYTSADVEPVVKDFCILVFISAMYCDYSKAVSLFSSVSYSPQVLLITNILSMWICSLSSNNLNRHQMKVSLLVIVEMMNYSDNIASQYLPSLMPLSVQLCASLRKDYQKPSNEDDDNTDDDYYSEASSTGSIEYEDGESKVVPMEDAQEDDKQFDDDDGSYYDEVYTTFIDKKEYDMMEMIIFNDKLKVLQDQDSQYLFNLLSTLNHQQQQQLNAISEHIYKIKLEKQNEH